MKIEIADMTTESIMSNARLTFTVLLFVVTDNRACSISPKKSHKKYAGTKIELIRRSLIITSLSMLFIVRGNPEKSAIPTA